MKTRVKPVKRLRQPQEIPTREQYVVAAILVAAIQAADALYSATDDESERCNDKQYMAVIKELVLESCSRGMVENLHALVSECYDLAVEREREERRRE